MHTYIYIYIRMCRHDGFIEVWNDSEREERSKRRWKKRRRRKKKNCTGFKSHHVIRSVALPYTQTQRAPDYYTYTFIFTKLFKYKWWSMLLGIRKYTLCVCVCVLVPLNKKLRGNLQITHTLVWRELIIAHSTTFSSSSSINIFSHI